MEKLFTALPTPFLNNKIDYDSVKKLVNFQIRHGVEAIVLAGSTGEIHSLSLEEWTKLIEFCVNNFQNKISIVAGVSSNITNEAVKYAKLAEKIGVKYILATTPYYNKPQQSGLYKHFKEICKAVKKTKIILYNVPGRTVTDLKNETIAKLVTDFSQIVALKDATGDLERVCDLKNRLKNIRDNFVMLSGEDATQIGFNAMGGNGVISVVSNIRPDLCKKIQNACKDNDYKKALSFQNELFTYSKAMFCETNPVPVKYALYKMGVLKSPECRLPLDKISKENIVLIDNLIKKTKTQN